MTPTQYDEVLMAFKRLERQNRWLKLGFLCISAVVFVGLFAGAADKPQPKPLDTSKLTIRDADGNERGYFLGTKDGMAIVFSTGDRPRSALILAKDAAYLQVIDGSGQPLSGLSVQSIGVSTGFRNPRTGRVTSGPNAILEVVGQSLDPQPLVSKPK